MGIPIATITCEGRRLDSAVELLTLEVRRDLNRIPEASLTFIDGSIAARKFEVSNSPAFAPGNRVVVALRYENGGGDTVVFEGLVVRHGVETQARGSVLRIELKDAAFRLTRQRKSAVFRRQNDEDAIRKLVKDAQLEVGDLATTQTKHDELIQFYASDWDFIVSRADVQGLVVDVHRGRLALRSMVPQTPAKARIEYGLDDAVDVELEIDGATQWAAMSSTGWDVQKLAAAPPTDARAPSVKVGNLDPAAIARKLGGDAFALQHPGVPARGELAAWADGRLARSRLALLRGRVGIPGRADLAPLDVVDIAGIGDRFDGKAMISGVTHRLDHGGWRTELQIGLPAQPFARQPEITDMPAAGLLPSIDGLRIGVVGDYEKDPRGEHRVKVALAGVERSQGAVWARVARPDAGKNRGFVWWPEPGDEVLLGFVNGDPREAIVLGGVHGSVNTPPEAAGPPSKDNPKHAIVSKKGLTIAFDDRKPAMRFEAPGPNSIVLDGDDKSIRIADQHGNTITLDSKGITLKSAKDFTIDAGSGKVVIKGSTVDVQ